MSQPLALELPFLLRLSGYGGRVGRVWGGNDCHGIPMLADKALMDEYTELTGTIIGAAMEVHSHWGPGLIESIYEKSLAHELQLRGVKVQRQVKLQLKYKDLELEDDFTLDLIADEKVIVELKVVKELAPIHQAQLMTYMKLTDCKIGLLINFNVVHLKEGIRRLTLPN